MPGSRSTRSDSRAIVPRLPRVLHCVLHLCHGLAARIKQHVDVIDCSVRIVQSASNGRERARRLAIEVF